MEQLTGNCFLLNKTNYWLLEANGIYMIEFRNKLFIIVCYYAQTIKMKGAHRDNEHIEFCYSQIIKLMRCLRYSDYSWAAVWWVDCVQSNSNATAHCLVNYSVPQCSGCSCYNVEQLHS